MLIPRAGVAGEHGCVQARIGTMTVPQDRPAPVRRPVGANVRLAAMLALAFTAACGGDEPSSALEVRVDTLSDGRVRVSSPAEGTWARTGQPPWALEEDLRIGRVDGEGPDLFVQIGSVVPQPDGRIWIMDSGALELRVFAPDGSFEFSVGGPGQGPGEFAGPGPGSCAFAGPGEEIWVEDRGRRWHRFTRSGTYRESHAFFNQNVCGTRQWTPDGRFVVRHSRMDPTTFTVHAFYVAYRIDDVEGLVAGDTIAPPETAPPATATWVSPDGIPSERTIPFTPRPQWRLDVNGAFWVSDGGPRYEIHRQRLAGDTVLTIERSYEPVGIPDPIRRQAGEDLVPDGTRPRGEWDPARIPRVYPPFEWYYIGTDGTLWVTRRVEDGTLALDVFDAEGWYLGEVEAPEEFERMSIQAVTADHIYARLRDELGIHFAVRLAIRRASEGSR